MPAPPTIPPAQREFRAAWVATVANIDWPSAPGLDAETQKAEALHILDSAADLGLNALILQVRPQCDALYPSPHEPWSYYLSGTQGQPPSPYYDPLEFWIEAAHDRGLELHAWFNPYRAHHPKGGEVSPVSFVHRRPDLAVKLGEEGYYWLDPAKEGTQRHTLAVILDVLRRYDVDGIHLDDYFYPYPSYHGGDFPDEHSWAAYRHGGGKLSRADWRRDHVNRFVETLYKAIKKEKKQVKFGISPFGIWRPGQPPSIAGLDQYEVLYADALLWWKKGWVDYWMPQLYWPIAQIPQSYPVLLGWWAGHNDQQRHLWPGIISGRAVANGADEYLNQIMIARGFVPQGPGHAHFSMRGLLDPESDLAAKLKSGPYARGALVPPSPWLGHRLPAAPRVRAVLQEDQLMVVWTHPRERDIFRWVVYCKRDGIWDHRLLNRDDRVCRLPLDQENPLQAVAVSAVDRLGNESSPKQVPVGPPKTSF